MPEPDREPTILEILNERITILQNELFQANLLLDELNVPSKSKSGGYISLVGRMQWLLSYTNAVISHKIFQVLINYKVNPITFSNN